MKIYPIPILSTGKNSIFTLLSRPECPCPFLGRDVLQKLGTYLIFGNCFLNILTLLSEGKTSISEEPVWLSLKNPEIWQSQNKPKMPLQLKFNLKIPLIIPINNNTHWNWKQRPGYSLLFTNFSNMVY